MNVSISHPTDRPNFSRVSIGNLDLWFSYETVIAFTSGPGRTVISENVWSTTTGKHLNWIDSDKTRRLPHEDFLVMLAARLTSAGLA
jgi:hypothetical protein